MGSSLCTERVRSHGKGARVCVREDVCVCVPDRPTDARLLFLQKYNVFDRSVKSSALC